MERFKIKDGVLISYKGNGGDIVIPDNLGIHEISNYAFAYPLGATDEPKFSSIVVPEGVSILDNGAFQGSHIEAIKLPSTLKKIGLRVFQNCKNLREIVLPDNLEEIGQEAFMHCENLQSIKIPKTVSKIGELSFNNCYSLDIDVSENSKFQYKSGIIFDNENNLISCTGKEKDVVIPDGVKIIPKEFFRHIETVENVEIPGSISKIETCAFYRSLITSISIPSSVEELGSQCFNMCGLLKSVVFENNSKLKSIPVFAFNKCSQLKDISLPDSIVEIKKGAFDSCKSLEKIKLSGSIEKIEQGAFCRCEKLKDFDLPKKDIVIEKNAFSGCDNLPDETKWQILELQQNTEKECIKK